MKIDEGNREEKGHKKDLVEYIGVVKRQPKYPTRRVMIPCGQQSRSRRG
jgi:hypothetical protein